MLFVCYANVVKFVLKWTRVEILRCIKRRVCAMRSSCYLALFTGLILSIVFTWSYTAGAFFRVCFYDIVD